jgi:hypothetical protein
MKQTELTDAQIARNDFVHNTIFNCIQELVPGGKERCELDWDIEPISEVADVIEAYLVGQGICTSMEFSPFLS